MSDFAESLRKAASQPPEKTWTDKRNEQLAKRLETLNRIAAVLATRLPQAGMPAGPIEVRPRTRFHRKGSLFKRATWVEYDDAVHVEGWSHGSSRSEDPYSGSLGTPTTTLLRADGALLIMHGSKIVLDTREVDLNSLSHDAAYNLEQHMKAFEYHVMRLARVSAIEPSEFDNV